MGARNLAWLFAAGCLSRPTASPGAGSGSDGAVPAPTGITHVQAIASTGFMFPLQANAVGDAIIMHVSCGDDLSSPSITLDAPPSGWHITTLTSGGSPGYWAALFGMVVTDTEMHTISIGTGGSSCAPGGLHVLADEFSNANLMGGPATFGIPKVFAGAGSPCAGAVVTTAANEAIWAACTYSSNLTGAGSGFMQGATDGTGDFSEYVITTDMMNTPELITFSAGSSSSYVTSEAVIVPP